MPDTPESKRVRPIFWVLGGIAVMLLAFGLGITVGYHKAVFAMQWGENYPDNFFSTGPAFSNPGPWNAHGVVGSVIDIASNTVSVMDEEREERSVVILPGAMIMSVQGPVVENDIDIGDVITAIGEPNDQGQLDARFIRIIMEATSSDNPQ